MPAAKRHTEESGETGIDLAPMLDFVLNLLIFFIITTSFVKEPGIQVNRADAETAVHREKGNILTRRRSHPGRCRSTRSFRYRVARLFKPCASSPAPVEKPCDESSRLN